MKKKAEYHVMKNDVSALQEENKNLKDKVSVSILFLFTIRSDQRYVNDAVSKDGGK